RVGLGKAADDDLVFASEAGTPIDPSNLLANSYYPLLIRAGLPRLPFNAGTPSYARHVDDRRWNAHPRRPPAARARRPGGHSLRLQPRHADDAARSGRCPGPPSG